MGPRKILIVDDEVDIIQLLAQGLHHAGFHVSTASDGEKALEKCREENFDVLLSDVRLPGRSGLEIARDVKRLQPQCRLLFMTGFPKDEDKRVIRELDAVAYLYKPIDFEALMECLRACFQDGDGGSSSPAKG